MGMTPEGQVKHKIKQVLKKYGAWYYMPVPGGYGEPTLDFICSYHSITFAIEAKAHGKKPTPRQKVTINTMERTGIRTFVIDGDKGLKELRDWLDIVGDKIPVLKKLIGTEQTLDEAK